MFGFIVEGIALIAAGASFVKGRIDDAIIDKGLYEEDQKRKVPFNTYYDMNGGMRLRSTGRRVEFKKIDGDLCLIDAEYKSKNYGKVVRNLTEEERIIDYNERVRKNPTATAVLYRNNDLIGPYKYLGGIEGKRYRDTRDGRIYVIRKLPVKIQKDLTIPEYLRNSLGIRWKEVVGVSFYMDVHTGLLVRPTDGMVRYMSNQSADNGVQITFQECSNFAKFFNEKQRSGGYNKWFCEHHKDLGIEWMPGFYYDDGDSDYARERNRGYFFCNSFTNGYGEDDVKDLLVNGKPFDYNSAYGRNNHGNYQSIYCYI